MNKTVAEARQDLIMANVEIIRELTAIRDGVDLRIKTLEESTRHHQRLLDAIKPGAIDPREGYDLGDPKRGYA